YGKTVDHVRRLSVVLADGTRTAFGPLTAAEWDQRAAIRSLEGAIYRGVRQIVRDNAEEIRRHFPRILRRVSGYNLDAMCDQLTDTAPLQTVTLAPLLVGSEGTLAVVTEAELALVPRPKVRGLLVPHFTSLAAALDALAACLEFGPSAVELLDRMLLDLA